MFGIFSCCPTSTSMGSLRVNSQDGQKSVTEKSVTQKSVTQKSVTSEINISRNPTSVSKKDVENFLDELLRESNNKKEDLQILLSIINNPEEPIKRLKLNNRFSEYLTTVLKDKCVRNVVEQRYYSLLNTESEIIRGSHL